jgi:hypothetical protein
VHRPCSICARLGPSCLDFYVDFYAQRASQLPSLDVTLRPPSCWMTCGDEVAISSSTRRSSNYVQQYASSGSIHAKRIICTRRRHTLWRRFPFDRDLTMILTFPPILSPQLEFDVCRTDENLDIEFGSVIFRGKVIPMSVLAFHVCPVQNGFHLASAKMVSCGCRNVGRVGGQLTRS